MDGHEVFLTSEVLATSVKYSRNDELQNTKPFYLKSLTRVTVLGLQKESLERIGRCYTSPKTTVKSQFCCFMEGVKVVRCCLFLNCSYCAHLQKQVIIVILLWCSCYLLKFTWPLVHWQAVIVEKLWHQHRARLLLCSLPASVDCLTYNFHFDTSEIHNGQFWTHEDIVFHKHNLFFHCFHLHCTSVYT